MSQLIAVCRDTPAARATAASGRYPAIIHIWGSSWEQHRAVPGVRRRDPACDLQTNAIEPISTHYRRAVRVRGTHQNEQAALKYLVLGDAIA
ncbi:transposase [Propionibacterium australiense]|uniref:transposase n=1 Tax=Propionibacterium australiense TaxID=119981 RepID=UPI001476DE08|nr:transposase [Propionibacterium australiense]